MSFIKNGSITLCLLFCLSGVCNGQLTITKGIDLEAAYIGESAINLNGGADQGIVYLHQTDLMSTFNTGELGLWKGGNFYFYGFDLRGGSPTTLAGDYQVISNIDAPDGLLLYEAWYEQVFWDGRLSVLGGLYGLDSEFDIIESASIFIQSSHGTGAELGASGPNGPSIFPYSSLALRVKFALSEHIIFQGAVLEAEAGIPGNNSGINVSWDRNEGLLFISEFAWFFGDTEYSTAATRGRHYRGISRTTTSNHKTKIALGGWTYSKSYDSFSSSPLATKAKSRGLYLLTESKIYSDHQNPSRGLTVFGRIGTASEESNRLSWYSGGGAVYTGLIKNRNKDQLGLGFAAAFNGNLFIENIPINGNEADHTETNIELTYLAQLHDKISVQFDYQYVSNPNTDPSINNASLILLRLMLNL
ncbi:carbohydrate porin [Balneola sp. MJW-20]|uniref:carbohydrate porin n=1 Tax=Gracilimonas aurantiaca TaxID=3234185 RepID=UPI003467BCE2